MKAFLFALCCLVLLTGPVRAADGAAPSSPLPVVSGIAVLRFYDLPGCPICATIHPIVDGLQKKHPADLRVEKVDSTVESSKPGMDRDGVKGHGVVVFDRNGKALYKSESHELNRPALDSAVEKATQSRPASAAPASAAPAH
jgi:thiol-disulfide isomerase/thioredoxin